MSNLVQTDILLSSLLLLALQPLMQREEVSFA